MESEAKSGEGRFTYREIFEHIKNGKYSKDWPKQTNFLSEKEQRFQVVESSLYYVCWR